MQAEAESPNSSDVLDGDDGGGIEIFAGNRGRKRTAARRAAGRGRGRGRGPDRQSYSADTVLSMEDEQPIGLLRLYVGGSQLTAQCDRCGLRVNRQYTPHHERPGAFPTGRPAGTLLAGLQQPCNGIQAHHRQAFFYDGHIRAATGMPALAIGTRHAASSVWR